MPTPRKPVKVLEKSGAFRKNPNRRRVEPKVSGSIGDPPDYFSDAEIEAWQEVANAAPEKVLASTDRLFVEMVSRLLAQFRTTPAAEMKAAMYQQLQSMFSRLGMSPADRGRVAPVEDKEEDNPWANI